MEENRESINLIRVITAPMSFNLLSDNSISVFLAGGITNCKEWQDEVIDALKVYRESDERYDIPMLTILNPRRWKFDVNDPSIEYQQISWEHRMLSKCDYVSFFFDNSESLQPITLYELGRWSMIKPTIISIVDGYKRQNDVLIQKQLDGESNIFVYDTYDEAVYGHADRILRAVKGE